MDSSSSQSTASSNSSMVTSERTLFYQTYCPHHSWSLPDSIIYYISKHPSSPKVYQKMVQCCKYFFVKNPIFVIIKFYNFTNLVETPLYKLFREVKNITLKIWITDALDIKWDDNQNFLSSILPNIYRFNGNYLRLQNQVLSYADICIFISAEHLDLENITLKSNDGSTVAFEKLIEAFPKLKRIRIKSDNNTITSKTVKELVKFPHFLRLEYIYLQWISEEINLEDFYNYIKQNKHTICSFWFGDLLSKAYRTRLEEIVDEIISTKSPDFKVPYINFNGHDIQKAFKLYMKASGYENYTVQIS